MSWSEISSTTNQKNVHISIFGFSKFYIETKSTLPLSSEDVTVSPIAGDNNRREIAQNAAQNESNVQQLQRESGDGASANPTETETTSTYQRRTKPRTGSLFDDDDDDDETNENTDAEQATVTETTPTATTK